MEARIEGLMDEGENRYWNPCMYSSTTASTIAAEMRLLDTVVGKD